MAIVIAPNPTADQLSSLISSRYDWEIKNIDNQKWATGKQTVAFHKAEDALKSANDFLSAIGKATANPPAAQKGLADTYAQVWRKYLAGILAWTGSADTRKAALDDAAPLVQSNWNAIQQNVQAAADPDAAIANELGQLEQVLSYTNSIGTMAVSATLRKYVQAEMSALYPGVLWSDLTSAEQGAVTTQALTDAGLTDVSAALDFFGLAALGISIGLAFWDAANDKNGYVESLTNSLAQIGVGDMGSTWTSDAFTESDAPDILSAVWGTEGDVLAALIPTGFGMLVGIALSALVGVLFDLIFGTGVDIPPELLVSITVPITTSTTVSITADITAS